ncbi:50S ribosomal protein L19 [Ponticaulis sp.]|uniref:50S ribosomal protein L19 n=1 Tax=Ponticaulis sp. TaxID=2020902 RepID=UPI000B6BCA20|nr:50S ribosomal protein L19 [Ponticaulis sp.]OUX99525.1 MAG: 50S ribosomal protein L19 [Hyphomonadaceae bacterium TMED5]|tara:strand:+ start:83647 stop:84192 length:546 start_codon:yes stop_codon:yes gene_type:complete
MTNIIAELEKEEIARVAGDKEIPNFSPGDTLTVNVKIKEGDRERVQRYEGVCIARSGGGLNESFTVRKISFGEGVERVFPLYSPNIESIEVKRKGKVRRAKLYYLRDRRGKSARIAERTTGHGIEVRENILGKTERKRKNEAAKAERKARAAEERAAQAKAKEAEAAAAAEAEANAEGGEE